jgi:hypothetical protein
MRILMGAALALLLITPFVRAADVTGKWSGSAELKTPDGDAQVLPVQAEFKRQDKSLSGSIGKAGDQQWPIAKGKIEDGKINFEFEAAEGDEASGKRLYTVRLTVVSETQLQGEFDFAADGNKVTGKLTLTREK